MNPETVNKTLISISKWGKATGILFIIMGAFTALSGAFFFLIGAVPGVLQIISGIFLMRSAKEAGLMAEKHSGQSEDLMLENYAKFVKMQGIYLIVSIAVSILAIIAFFIFLMLGIADGIFNDYDTYSSY
ncbi:DUF5362 family protein [Bacillus mojavensis]|jgi:hypothetical protein|uniref:DUF5362 domain-containing protein n=1 Tax=Bacillus mojavensis TaxID=72360 RepID=A0AAP3CTI4_BACMO|nr:DUF5362 family protein [Bacillus mojavensis]MCY8105275.1 DUF5362 domain-containing protein [Bacillus mojavensis]MCY8482599.1 DUF5362 domain-containing protein [Bacillus mojavensis]MCY8510906.1 DUF5362 domain-containing protein [Bacillus mojavensis]MCY9089966.1 DUF5362 domain-containing protein [Bacillus mojavensis]MEC1681166.1 DUF5362 family protein [Bacillus mojavensis]